MTGTQQRGSRVIYVAASAREFPAAVQDFLIGPGSKATRCGDIYEALALLAIGRKPNALLVSIDALDWNELEFFDHVLRLSPQTSVFVAGQPGSSARLEAALARGAMPFNAAVLTEIINMPVAPPVPIGPAGLLAGTLRADPPPPAAAPRVVPPEPVEAEEPEESAEQPAAEQQVDEAAETLPPPPSPVRLVSDSDADDEMDRPVPFPWSPASNRPQRTPPRVAPASSAPAEDAPRASTGRPLAAKLTPEELEALLGISRPPGNAQEGLS